MNKLLLEGLTDAAGFIGGALLGYGLGQLFGFDAFVEGYGAGAMVGIALVGIGGGMGLQAARKWRANRKDQDQ